MADSLSLSMRSRLAWSRSQDKPFGTVSASPRHNYDTSYIDGDSGGIIQRALVNAFVVPANGLVEIDLSTASQTMLAATVPESMSVVHFFRAINKSETSSLYLIADPAAPFTNYACRIGPLGEFTATNASGWVVNSENNPFNIANSGGSPAICELYIYGA